MTTVTPPADVAEPTPEAAGYGLYSGISVLDPDDAHVQSGVRWEPTVCGVAGAFPVNCASTAGWPLPTFDGIPLVDAAPFGVSSGQDCKIVGTPIERLRALARARLRYTEQRAVENAYWTGDVFTDGVVSPHLAAGDAATPGGLVTVLSDVAVKPAVGLGLLEEAIGNFTGAVGVIHAPRVGVGVLGSQVSESRGRLLTKVGTRVVFGTGYPGSGPDGQARTDEATWLFATGPVQVVRGPILDLPGEDREALDRETNIALVQAVRIVSIGHSCGLVAVPINLTL